MSAYHTVILAACPPISAQPINTNLNFDTQVTGKDGKKNYEPEVPFQRSALKSRVQNFKMLPLCFSTVSIKTLTKSPCSVDVCKI